MSLDIEFPLNETLTYDVDQCSSLSITLDKLAEIIRLSAVVLAGETETSLNEWLLANDARMFSLQTLVEDTFYMQQGGDDPEPDPTVMLQIFELVVGDETPRCQGDAGSIKAVIKDEDGLLSSATLKLVFPDPLNPAVFFPNDLTGQNALCVLEPCETVVCKSKQTFSGESDVVLFGSSVAVFGNKAAIASVGKVFIYDLDAQTGCWQEVDCVSQAVPRFDVQVALSDDVLLVTDNNGVNIYEWNGASWQFVLNTFSVEQQTYGPTIATAGDWAVYQSSPTTIQFHRRTAPLMWQLLPSAVSTDTNIHSLSFDGTTLAVSISHKVNIYTFDVDLDAWTFQQQIDTSSLTTSVNGEWMIVGDPDTNSVLYYKFIGNQWEFSSIIVHDVDNADFGRLVALSETRKTAVATDKFGNMIEMIRFGDDNWNRNRLFPEATVPTQSQLFQTIDVSGNHAFAGKPSENDQIEDVACSYWVNPIVTSSGCIIVELPCGDFVLTCTDTLLDDSTELCQKWKREFEVTDLPCDHPNIEHTQFIDVNIDFIVGKLLDRCNLESIRASEALAKAAEEDEKFLKEHVAFGCAPDIPTAPENVEVAFFDQLNCSRCCRNDQTVVRTWTVSAIYHPPLDQEPCIFQTTIVQNLRVTNPRWARYFPSACACPCPPPVQEPGEEEEGGEEEEQQVESS